MNVWIASRLERHSAQAWLPAGPEGDVARREIAAFLQAVASSPEPPGDGAGQPPP